MMEVVEEERNMRTLQQAALLLNVSPATIAGWRMHDHCRICADACRACAEACSQLLDSLG